MNISREEAQQILDALSYDETYYKDHRGDRAGRAIDTLMSRLAEGEQEPSKYSQGYGVALSDAEEAIDDECRERVVTASDCIEIIRNLGAAPQGAPK